MARVSPSKQNQTGKKKPYKNSTAYWANEIAKVDDGRARIPVELKEGFYNAWKREGKSPQRVYFIWKGTNPYARKGFFQSYGTRSSQRGGDPYQPSYYENNMAKGARRRAKQKQATIELIDYFDEFKKKWPDAPDKDVAQLAQNAFDVDQTYLKIAAGEISPKIHYEHTQPLSKGGLETRINVEMDDADFNVTKGAKEPSELTKSKYNIVSNKGEAIEQSLQSPVVNPRSEQQFVERRSAIRKDLGYSKDITPEAIQAQSNVQQRFGQALSEMEFKTAEQALANIDKVRKETAKRMLFGAARTIIPVATPMLAAMDVEAREKAVQQDPSILNKLQAGLSKVELAGETGSLAGMTTAATGVGAVPGAALMAGSEAVSSAAGLANLTIDGVRSAVMFGTHNRIRGRSGAMRATSP